MEIVENGKQNIKRKQAVAFDDAAVDQSSLCRRMYDLGDISSGHGNRQLIEEYLKPKLFNQPLPKDLIINDIDIYLHSPEILAEMYKHCGDEDEDQIKERYYFTPRYRKYPNGSRPRRLAGDGYWKATGTVRQIKDKENTIIGFWKTLVFYKGEPPKGQKTNWIMREYRLNNPPPLRPTNHDIMRLDDCVLCSIYQKVGVVIKAAKSTSLLNGEPLQSPIHVCYLVIQAPATS